jgi:serine acetyltransferase
MSTFTSRALLKLQNHYRRFVVGNPGLLESSQGFDGVARLLASSDGEDAVRLLRWGGATVGTGARVAAGLVIWNHGGRFLNLTIGNACHIGAQVFLDLASPVVMGDRVTVSMRVTILTHTDVGDSRCGIPASRAAVRIESDAYVGAGATIVEGVTIGHGAVVAAGALVNRNVASHTVVAGVPARFVRDAAAALPPRDHPEAWNPEQ